MMERLIKKELYKVKFESGANLYSNKIKRYLLKFSKEDGKTYYVSIDMNYKK